MILNGTPILVTGGAGFIGSHCAKALAQAGYLPVVYDNLSNGDPAAVQWGPLEVGDLNDPARLSAVVAAHKPKAVIHLAASTETGISVGSPLAFYRNNIANTLNLLDVLRGAGIDALVFSSTAAVYGAAKTVPIAEDERIDPINPYGASKSMVERILSDVSAVSALRFITLRYFNASGADPEGDLVEAHRPETHLIPLAIEAAFGRRPELQIFGDDYPTPDGTCIRDYVHVSDLARAHTVAVRRLLDGGGNLTVNLGTGIGASNRQVLDLVRAVTGRAVPHRVVARRPGDPPSLIAKVGRARTILGWTPRYPELRVHIEHASRALQRQWSLDRRRASGGS